MRKASTVVVLFLLLIVVSVLALFGSLHTRYATSVVNFIANQVSNLTIQIENVEYQSPYQLTLHGVELSTQPEPMFIETANIWLDPEIFDGTKISIASLQLSGLQLQKGVPNISPLSFIKVHQIAVDNLDFSNQEWIVRGLKFQIKQPVVSDHPVWRWYGEIQLSADQIYWQNEAFNHALLDADIFADSKKIYGLSFSWRGGTLSGQAEWKDGHWNVVNAALNELTVTKNDWKTLKKFKWASTDSSEIAINRLDVLRSDLEFPSFAMVQADMTLEDIRFPFELWKQPSGSISLNAESIDYADQLWLEPALEASFSPELITVHSANLGMDQGYIQVNGEFTPDTWHLAQLNLTGIEWHSDSELSLTPFKEQVDRLANLTIDQLSVKRAQYIDLESEPKRQISGLNIQGNQLDVLRNGQVGLWQGRLALTANSANFGKLIGSQLLVEAHANAGISYLDKVIIPVNDGLIRAQGQWDYRQHSRPWALKFQGDGIPIETLQHVHPLPLDLSGLTDTQFELSGLSGDAASFNHSVSGFISTQFRDLTTASHFAALMDPSIPLELSKKESEPVSVSDFIIDVDRGRITMQESRIRGGDFTGSIHGNVDLVNAEKGSITLMLKGECGEWRYQPLSSAPITREDCQTLEKLVP
ncbi:AsmA family protein [Vibrio penaeicida]|uniref:AsmA family protein n=1 Tax=Vibrio penaeicida TaxID=104609 RepID=UPI002736F3B0|nr:AsmA family protein [Vibrio penaeicida]MDP2574877.1 AsmA family protein [Vibrio penaeicida]